MEHSKRSLQQHIDLLDKFVTSDLRSVIARFENAVGGLNNCQIKGFLDTNDIKPELLVAAAEVKRISSQIDVTMHALGILSVLPHLLEDGEILECVSLGAGNTGRKFDLETNFRIAEFKFIKWRGGPESIRQNGIFKDFFDLATAETSKRRYLYLLGTKHALKFFNGRRAMGSVLSKNQATKEKFDRLYGDTYKTVGQYFEEYSDTVQFVDVSMWLPEFVEIPTTDELFV